MPLVLYLPAHRAAAPSLTRRLHTAAAAWLSGVRLGTRILRDEAHLREVDQHPLADVGLTREDVARGAIRSGLDR